jgi:hypothetical protein
VQQLPPEYLAEIARQIGFISAFLGGVAATFVVALIGHRDEGRATSWAIGCAAASCVAFIVAVVATTMLAVTLRPDTPATVAASAALMKGRLLSFLSFALGLYLLLASLGLMGWLRSRRMGRVTTSLAVIGALLVTFAISG